MAAIGLAACGSSRHRLGGAYDEESEGSRGGTTPSAGGKTGGTAGRGGRGSGGSGADSTNNNSQLGLGHREGSLGDQPGEMGNNLPALSLGTGRRAVRISAGGVITCALLDDGSVKCWGQQNYGELGQGDNEARGDDPGEMGDALLPVSLGAGRRATLTANEGYHACALLDDGAVKCWGSNDFGILGLGGGSHRGNEPGEMGDDLPVVALGDGRRVTSVVAGVGHTCAGFDDGSVKCWGGNTVGQLGQGDVEARGWRPEDMGDALPTVDLGTRRFARVITAHSQTCEIG